MGRVRSQRWLGLFCFASFSPPSRAAGGWGFMSAYLMYLPVSVPCKKPSPS